MATRAQTLESLRSRRDPERLLKEGYDRVKEDEAVRYLIGAMEPVNAKHTKTTYGEAERVKSQLASGLGRNGLTAEYEYQGSVTKNTHIKAYSDVDLLVLDSRFVTLERPQEPGLPYQGNPVEDLLQIRSICISHLTDAFPQATVDASGARSVKISGGSLLRVVDLVPSNWYDTNEYKEKQQKFYRGIQILNAPERVREIDRPFLHTAWIEWKDTQTRSNARKLIRLLKSLKYDSEGRATMSSFDIESLVFRMPSERMQHSHGEEIQLAAECCSWLKQLESQASLREGLDVPDAHRRIFTTGKATLAQLTALRVELDRLLAEIAQGLQRSFRKLAEARVAWPE